MVLSGGIEPGTNAPNYDTLTLTLRRPPGMHIVAGISFLSPDMLMVHMCAIISQQESDAFSSKHISSKQETVFLLI